MRFDLTDLRLFLHVIDSGSLTAGAQRSHLALASASQRVRGMEETLGVPLLRRLRHGVEPTAAGLALAGHSRVVLERVERMHGELAAYGRGLRGTVRLLSNTSGLTERLPRSLAGFLAANPAIDLDLEEMLSMDIVGALAAGRADIGIIAHVGPPPDLEGFDLGPDRLVLVVPANDPLAREDSVRFAAVAGREFVGVTRGSALQNHVEAHAARLGHALRLRARVRQFEAVARMVEAGVGIAVLPEMTAERCRDAMDIAAVGLTDDWTARRLRLCARAFDELPEPARRLAGHLHAALQPEGSVVART